MNMNRATAPSQHLAPPLVIDAHYAGRLEELIFGSQTGGKLSKTAQRLLDEIDRARLVPGAEMPPDVVTIGSTVTYRDDATGQTRSVVLVMPGSADIGTDRVSVFTPIGAALIGVGAGASIDWETPGGDRRLLTVVDVRPGQD